MVCFPTERLGAEKFTHAMHEFSYFISAHGLVDLPFEGGYITWFNIRGMSIDPELTVFFFQQIGRITSQIFLKEGCVAFRPLPDSLWLWKLLEGQKMIQIRECVVKSRGYMEKVRTW